MAVQVERLVATLEARLDKFEKEISRASKGADRDFKKITKAGDKMEARLAKMGTNLKAFGVGLVGGLFAGGVTGTIAAFGRVANSVAQIGDEAKRAGVSAQAFQEWAAVASRARIPVDALVDGLKELSLRGDEFALTGKGSAAEAFARLGYGADELKVKLKDPSALMLEIIERMGQMDKAAQIRISDELFGGTGGEKFVQLLDQGADSIRETIDEAHRLGNVLSDQVIADAAELDRKFQIVADTVGTNLKRAVVEAAFALKDFINSFQGFEAQRDTALDEKLATLGKERLDVERKIFELRSRTDGLAGDGILGTSVGDSGTLGGIADQERRLEAIAAEEQMILKVVEARRKAREVPPPASTGGAPPPYTPPTTSGGDKRPNEYERDVAQIRARTAALIAETAAQVGLAGTLFTIEEMQ